MSLSNRNFIYMYHVYHNTVYGLSVFFSCRRGLLLQREKLGWDCKALPVLLRDSSTVGTACLVPGTELGALCSYCVYSSPHPCEIDALTTFSG